jgi:pyridinium-3,5-bisthiocarboxylic acid mononucleotide nickel chelatase
MTAYFDCFSGISGDMCLGALVDAGAPMEAIEKKLKKLHLGAFSITKRKVRRAGLAATKVDVVITKSRKGSARRWEEIRRIIKNAPLRDDVKEQAERIFRTLFEAEALVHGVRMHKAHLHELGAIDCLVDVFGTLIALDLLGIETVHASPVNLGGGTVKTAHGILPVPAPATAEILRGFPVYQAGAPFELTTPTGAAILATLSERFGAMPPFVPEKIGMGAGSREIQGRPNVLRIMIGKLSGRSEDGRVTVIETNIDDMNPQIYEYLVEKLLRKGALDVFLTQVIMKKMRPGVKLSVVCDEAKRNALIDSIFRETTSIGVRYHEMPRITMDRKHGKVPTGHGKVGVKISRTGSFRKAMPEYEDCRKIAEEKGVPLLEIIEEAKRAAMETKKNH